MDVIGNSCTRRVCLYCRQVSEQWNIAARPVLWLIVEGIFVGGAQCRTALQDYNLNRIPVILQSFMV